jgi:chromosome segregation ATPase
MPHRQPRPQAALAAPSEVASTHAWYALRDEVMDRVDEVSEAVQRLDRQVNTHDDRLGTLQVASQHLEATHGTATADLRSLVTSNTALDGRFHALEGTLHTLTREFGARKPIDAKAIERKATARALEAAKSEQEFLVDSVRELLANFRAEIVASLRDVDKRCANAEQAAHSAENAAQRAVDSVADVTVRLGKSETEVAQLSTQLKSLTHSVESLRGELVDRTGRVDDRIEKCVAKVRHDCSEMLRETVSSSEASLRLHVADAVSSEARERAHDVSSVAAKASDRHSEVEALYDRLVDTCEAAEHRVGELQRLVEETNASVGRRFQQAEHSLQEQRVALSETRESLGSDVAGKLSSVVDRVSHVESSVETTIARFESFERHAAQSATASHKEQHEAVVSLRGTFEEKINIMADDLQALQQDVEQRHRSVVASTHQALEELASVGSDLPGSISTLKHDLSTLRDSFQLHESAIERTRIDGGALTELRDWMQDLERRAASKTEIDQVANALQSQVSSLKDASHNTETVLAQKIEAERSAREFDSAALRSQLQRIQSTRVSSP